MQTAEVCKAKREEKNECIFTWLHDVLTTYDGINLTNLMDLI